MTVCSGCTVRWGSDSRVVRRRADLVWIQSRGNHPIYKPPINDDGRHHLMMMTIILLTPLIPDWQFWPGSVIFHPVGWKIIDPSWNSLSLWLRLWSVFTWVKYCWLMVLIVSIVTLLIKYFGPKFIVLINPGHTVWHTELYCTWLWCTLPNSWVYCANKLCVTTVY